jgi:SecD/SecF fusion protein
MGIGAWLALLLYIPLIVWILVGLQGVLTLPGVAGVIVSIGMAVDANVIIFSRIKDEVALGKTIRVAVSSGFKKAVGTVLDAQLTTLIAAIVLFQLGTGPVRGFALMLIIGILVSLFTAMTMTNIYIHAFADSKFLVKTGLFGVKEGGGEQRTMLPKFFHFVKPRKIFYLVSIAVIVLGFSLGIGADRFNFGIDFTGGTMMQIELGKTVPTQDVRATLEGQNIENLEIVTFGDDNTGVIIRTTQAITSTEREEIMAAFEKDYGVSADALETFEQFGPSVGRMLTNNAILAVLISIGLMLVYIIIRFRFKLALAAIIATFHDAIVLIALYGIFSFTINNPFIAAILTVVGYSTNDTIVIFDRIRENLGVMRRQPLDEIVDKSVNKTLVRSIMTSLTTIVAIIPLVILGGDVVRQFTLPLILGIIVGTLSSIFTASTVFYDLSKGTHRVGTGKYQGAVKLSDADRIKLGAKIPEDEAADEEENTSAEGDEKPKHNSSGAKGKRKKSKSQRRPGGNGAVV